MCTPIKKFIRELEALEKSTDKTDPFYEIVAEELEFAKRRRVEDANKIPKSERRLIKTHLPFSLLPPKLLQENKVTILLSLCKRALKQVFLGYLRCQRSKRRRNILFPSPQAHQASRICWGL